MFARAAVDFAFSGDFSWEPRGDIGPKTHGPGRFYAVVSDVATAPATITFDVEQYYWGTAATKAAARNGESPFENGDYIYNRYRHKETLPVLADAPVILQIGVGDIEGDTGFGSERYNQVTSISFAEFARRFKSDPQRYGPFAGYVLLYDPYDGGRISVIAQVFFP
jgi:hypothetical protein